MDFTGYLDKLIRPLDLILPEMNGYAKTFSVKESGKHKSNKLIFFCIDDEILLEKNKKDLKSIELKALLVYE